MGAGFAPPPRLWRRRVSDVEQPRTLSRFVPVSALPDLARPLASADVLPADALGPLQPIGPPGIRERWMLEHTAEAPHRRERRRETATIVAGPVVLAAPTLEIRRGEVHP